MTTKEKLNIVKGWLLTGFLASIGISLLMRMLVGGASLGFIPAIFMGAAILVSLFVTTYQYKCITRNI